MHRFVSIFLAFVLVLSPLASVADEIDAVQYITIFPYLHVDGDELLGVAAFTPLLETVNGDRHRF